MFWFLAASAALGATQQGLANRANQKAAKAQNRANRAADLETVSNSAQALGALTVQYGQLKVDASRQLQEARQEAAKATGTATAQAAAAQVKGASVDAVLNDIDNELSAAETSVHQAVEAQSYNLSQRVREIQYGALGSLRGLSDPHARDGSVLLAGAMSAGSAYLNNAMQFGSFKTGT